MRNQIVYDIAQPYQLYSALCGLILRDKTQNIKIYNDESKGFYDPNNTNSNGLYLFNLELDPDQENSPIYIFLDSEGIKEEYISSIYTLSESISENDISTYFYYLGKLLGQFCLLSTFNRTTQIPFLNDHLIKLKSSITILINSFRPIAKKFETFIAETLNLDSEDIKNNQFIKVIFEPSENFNDFLDSLDYYTDGTARDLPISTIFALTYMSLGFVLFGLIPKLIVKNSVYYSEFLKKCSIGAIEDTLNNLIVNTDDKFTLDKFKIYSLCYTFKVMSNFYINDLQFSNIAVKNISFEAFFNIGSYIEKYLNNNTDTAGKDIITELVTNTIFNILPNVHQFCDMSHWLSLEKNRFGLASECDNPLIYFKTLTIFLQKEVYVTEENLDEKFHVSTLQNMYFIQDKISSLKRIDNKIDFEKMKIFIEKFIDEETKIVSPKNIFKLLYIAGYLRQYYFGTNIVTKDGNTEDKRIAKSIVIMIETIVYNLYQEWFNRKNKIYRFEKRMYVYDELTDENAYKMLRYECLVTLMDYMRICFDSRKELKGYLAYMNTEDLVLSMHYEFRKMNSYVTPENIELDITYKLKSLQDNNDYGIEYMIDLEKGRIGIIYLLLAYPKEDILIKIMTMKIPLTEFFRDFEENNDRASAMRNFILSMKPIEKIKGFQSDSYIYGIINTRVSEILGSSLDNIKKFYLTYCLNYQFLKTNQAENFASGIQFKDVIAVGPKDNIVEEDRMIADSMESISKTIFGPSSKRKPEIYNKYGF